MMFSIKHPVDFLHIKWPVEPLAASMAIEKNRDFPGVRPALEYHLSEQEMLRVLARATKIPFNVQVFLKTVDGGRTVATYRKDETVFSQGDPADSVFFSRRVRSRCMSYQNGVRRRSSPSMGVVTSLAKVA